MTCACAGSGEVRRDEGKKLVSHAVVVPVQLSLVLLLVGSNQVLVLMKSIATSMQRSELRLPRLLRPASQTLKDVNI